VASSGDVTASPLVNEEQLGPKSRKGGGDAA